MKRGASRVRARGGVSLARQRAVPAVCAPDPTGSRRPRSGSLRGRPRQGRRGGGAGGVERVAGCACGGFCSCRRGGRRRCLWPSDRLLLWARLVLHVSLTSACVTAHTCLSRELGARASWHTSAYFQHTPCRPDATNVRAVYRHASVILKSLAAAGPSSRSSQTTHRPMC